MPSRSIKQNYQLVLGCFYYKSAFRESDKQKNMFAKWENGYNKQNQNK